MTAIRSTLYLLWQIITVIPQSIICLIVAVLPLSWRYRITMVWVRGCIWGAKVICGIDWQVQGADNLPDGPAILLSKHQSTWETLFYPGFMPRELCYVFKRELLFVPFFGWGIGLLEMIHINRNRGTDAFEQVVRQGVEKLAHGRWIIMFPEGTRIPVGQTGRYKSGGARLAIRTGAPIVPIAVNSGRCWPKKAFLKQPGTITVSIGKPIDSTNRKPDELTAQVREWIESEMRRISPQDYTDDPATNEDAPTAGGQANP